MEAVGGIGGAQGLVRVAVCAGGHIVVTCVPCLVPARLCSTGAWRQRNERGAFRALVAGPMASCASIDIEDATQHLRDILKLDRPAGGEPGQRGWALAEGQRGGSSQVRPQGLQAPPDRLGTLRAGEGRRWLER